MSSEDVATRLASRGLRMTRQRRVVLDAVRDVAGHPDAHEIYQRARRVLPQISLGTVYRTLGVLRDADLVRELHLRGAHGRYEEQGDTHHHVLCTECGRIEDITAGAFGALAAQARAATDFEIEEHRLEFYGICPTCKATRERSTAAKTT